jgi:hypothetical protein
MKKILLTLLVSICATSFADTDVYINANIGLNTDDSTTVAYNANVGYMLNNYFGIEGGYTWNNTNYWDAAIKAVLPIPLIELYGKAGLTYIDSGAYNAGGFLYGIGIGIPVFPTVKINIEDYAISSVNTQNFVMLGLQFNL